MEMMLDVAMGVIDMEDDKVADMVLMIFSIYARGITWWLKL